MPSQALSRGDIFAGRYKVERAIGAGGMGTVFEAEHLETERRVALKVLLPQSLISETARERFKQEARVAGRLRHPNIVDVLDAGVDDVTGMPYLVMELLHGEDLGSRLERFGPIPPDEAVHMLQQIASALDCLHERSIVHRDLKPENLFLTWAEDGSPVLKLLDFGVAKVITDGKTSAFTLDAQGTPAYMAPEQFAEQIRISPATDIYALGMLAFTLLTGKHYWGAEVERGMNVFMLARIAEAGPKDPASFRAGRVGAALPAGFDDWFATITALVPGERYPTATVAIEVLADTIGMELEPIPPPRSRTFHFLSETTPRGERVESPASPMSGRAHRGLPEPSSTPDVELQPRSGHTPPGSARRSAPLWKQPTVMTSALLGIAAAITLAIGFAPSRPPDVRPPDVRLPPPEAAPAVAASSEPTGVPSATDPTSSAEGTSSSAPESPPAPSTSAVAPPESPAPSTTAVHKAPVAPTRRAPIAPTPVAPTSSKRPKYTRE